MTPLEIEHQLLNLSLPDRMSPIYSDELITAAELIWGNQRGDYCPFCIANIAILNDFPRLRRGKSFTRSNLI